MRLPVTVLLALLALPAAAHAGSVGLEGTQLVFRSDPGEPVKLFAGQVEVGRFVFAGPGHRAGPGCTSPQPDQIECPEAGVTGVSVVTGDGADSVSVFARVPVTLSLAGGDDEFVAQSSGAVAVDAGPGNDRGLSEARSVSLVGGEGDDRLELETYDFMEAPVVLDGGPGDDTLIVTSKGLYTTFPRSEREGAPRSPFVPVAITCGAGADRWVAGPRDRPGDGCAPHLAGITPDTVSSTFREGKLSARASGSVTLWRRGLQSVVRHRRIAHATFTARRGSLRVRLPKARSQPVSVSVRTRAGDERGETVFLSRLR